MEEQTPTQSVPAKPKVSNINNKRSTRILAVGVLGIIVVVILIWNNSRGGIGKQLIAYDNVLVSKHVMQNLTVPESLFAMVKIGAAANFPTAIHPKASLTLDGKPEIFFSGADYCPFCAAERWAVIVALSRFGNFSNLHYTTSSASDVYASTPTFTFYNSTYRSKYISFVAIEQATNQVANSNQTAGIQGYVLLQTPSASENNLINAFDTSGGIPFMDIANKSVIEGSTLSPELFVNKNWSTIIAQLYVTNSSISQAVLGSANLLTAEICKLTNNTPTSVCGQAYIQNIESFA